MAGRRVYNAGGTASREGFVMALQPIYLHQWIADNRHLLKPPVGNKMLYNGNFMVMVVGGPNQRTDYHVNPGEELFYQVERDIVLKVMEDGQPRDIPIRQGDLFCVGSA